MKTLLAAIAAVSALVTVPVATADDKHHAADSTAAAASATVMTSAEVRRVDKAGRRLTLKHEEIKSLDMPPMTMVFRVKDPAMLDKVKLGDKVRFSAENLNGAITVTSLEVEQ